MSFFLRESQQKVLVGHRITSPMLFGVKDQTGLGNNADEIKTAFTLFDNSVIRPKQNQVIDAYRSDPSLQQCFFESILQDS